MKSIVLSISIIFLSLFAKSQCFEIQSILVDACAGAQEGQNEMVIFKVGSSALNAANMSVSWPNNSWLGLTQNASTAADIATVNGTILGCGFLKEPVAGVLPANSKVLLITSTAWSPLAQSFANLTDTLIVLFQTAGNTSGHFANYNTAAGLRTLTITFNPPVGCTDAVTYDRTMLVNQAGNLGAQDGGAVEFTASGTASYVNHGCQAPFVPLSVDAGTNKTICAANTQTFSATASGVYTSINWSLGAGATGTFVPTNSVSTTYSPGAGDNGTIKLYVTISKACGTQTTTVKDSVNLTVLQIPNPVVSASSNTICSGNTSTLSYSLTNAANTGTTSVLWSPGSATTPSISVNSTNVYSVQVTNICGNKTSTVSVSTVPIPSVTLSALSPTACAGSTVSLSATSNVGNFNWTNPVSTNSVVVVSANTTTTGVVTTTNICGTDSKTYTLTVTPIPTIAVNNANVSLCSGQSATVTASTNATTYTWQPGGTVHTNTISLNTAGVYTVNTSNVCGSASATVAVTINAVPTISLSSSSSSICASGQTATLTLSGSSGTYTWSNGGSAATSTINAPGVYTATVTTASCGSATNSFTVSAIPNPSITLTTASFTACPGNTINITANSTVGNYAWTGSANTTATLSLAATTSTTGVVTTTNACASASANYSISVVPTPTVTVNLSNSSLCAGQSVTVTATSSEGNYVWQPGGITTNTIVLNSVGVYTVTTSNACFTTSATSSVTINSAPTLSIASTSNSLCTGGQLTTTLSLTGSTGTYSWSSGGTASTETVSTPGVYTATVTTSSCGTATSSFTINAIPNPTVNISTSSFTACPGSTLNITANSSEGNYAWSGSANTTATLAVTVSSSTTGVVTTTNACTSVSDNYTITVTPTPSLNIDFSNVSLCTGQTATVTATSSEGNYLWSPGSATTNTLLVNSAGIYTVTTSNNCFTTTATTTVTINSAPTLSISSSSPSLCAIGQTATLSLSGSTGTYTWSNGGNGQTTVINGPGVYTATVSTPSCGSTTSSFTVNAILTPSVTLSSSSSLLCNGATATLTAESNMSNEIWSNGSINTPTIVVGSAGVYTVGVSNACGSPTAGITIQSNSTPTLVLTPSSTLICPNETATLTVTGGSTPYSWSNSTSTGSVVTTTGGAVTVSNTNACGTGTAVVIVNVTSLNADVVANPTSGVLPVVVSFTNNSSNANSYTWNFGNGNSANTSTVSSQTYSVAGTYTVYLTATNGSCNDIDSLVITVLNEEPSLVIPNVFTPNNDSINDIFRVSGKNISEFSCTIFDRWGLQMYAWSDIKGGWDGKTDGKEVPDGTYFYIINAKSIDDKEIKKQGYLNLFK